jgi:hypothetical protein
MNPDGSAPGRLRNLFALHDHPTAEAARRCPAQPPTFLPGREVGGVRRRLRGTALTRLTHNGFSEGTPEGGPVVTPKGTGEK